MKPGGSITKPLTILFFLVLAALLLFWLFVYRPLSAQRKLEEATALIEGGDCARAIPILGKIMGSPAVGGEARLLTARCRTSLKNYREALALWEELAGDPDPRRREEAEYYLGWVAQQLGDQATAERRLLEYSRRYPASSRSGEVQLALARLKKASGELAAAREAYSKVLKDYPDGGPVREAQEELGDLNLAILYSPRLSEGSREYTVKSGDSFSSIAQRFDTTADLLKKINRTKGNLIRAGQKLKVPDREFEVVVSKSQNTLMLLYGGEFFKAYSVGTGKHNSTPVGKFAVVTKLIDPPWYHEGEQIPPDDPRNILGTRWMGFGDPYADYGIHGTAKPETIGTQSSAGCIRMINREVEELFDLIPRGTNVTVID